MGEAIEQRGGHLGVQGQLDGAEHRLLVVLQDECQDLHHLPVAAGMPEQLTLQLPEAVGHVGKRRAVAQRARLALDDRQVVPPVVDGRPWIMGAIDDPCMLAQGFRPPAAMTIRSGSTRRLTGRLANEAGML